MVNQLDLFTAAPSPARRPMKADTALLLAMSDDHSTARQRQEFTKEIALDHPEVKSMRDRFEAARIAMMHDPEYRAIIAASGRKPHDQPPSDAMKHARSAALPKTGAQLVDQSRSCCGRCETVGHPSNYTWHDAAQELLCQRCNADALGYQARPNENGVYLEHTERLALPRPVKGWQGCDLAEIELLDLGPHWIWATGYQLHSGDFRGSSSPLTDHPPYRAPTRTAALDAARAHLRHGLEDSDNPDARKVLDWLASLEQGELI